MVTVKAARLHRECEQASVKRELEKQALTP